jgi:hypothetical protein
LRTPLISQVRKGAGGHFTELGWIYRNHVHGQRGGFLGFWWASLGPALPLFVAAGGVAVMQVGVEGCIA